MLVLHTLTDADCNGGEPRLLDTISRHASRGVLLRDKDIAMLYMAVEQLYKLPGDGIDPGESREEAFLREIQEETGWQAEIVHALGIVDEHKYQNQFWQRSYCYIAHVTGAPGDVSLSLEEQRLGMRTVWMPIAHAIKQMRHAWETRTDGTMSFMLLRELLILEDAARWLERDGAVHL